MIREPQIETSVPVPTRHRSATEDLLSIVRAEYREMPGLHLTARQAERLWHLEPAECRELLDALVETGVLRRSNDGIYAKR